MSSLKLHNCLA